MNQNKSEHYFEVTTKEMAGLTDARGNSIKSMLNSDHGIDVHSVRVILGYHIIGDIEDKNAFKAIYDLFADPIIEKGTYNKPILDDFSPEPELAIQIGFKPGVTDNLGQAALDGFNTLFPNSKGVLISTTKTLAFWGLPTDTEAEKIIETLYNPMIERVSISKIDDCRIKKWPILEFPHRPKMTYSQPKVVNLEVSDKELLRISNNGLLALNLEEMQAIQAHFRDPKIQKLRISHNLPPKMPTDAELECLAQTWSEHCSHKIFAAKIEHYDTETKQTTSIDSLFKTNIVKPTNDISKEVDWLLSVFHDNSGVIAWNEDWSLCIKAETHNSPSALDPYGGAITGIVGVNRDIIGTGLGARPIANTDVFCFGPPDFKGRIPDGLFHPFRVFRGVHAGVRSGGNESGIPTVNGAIIFDERYIGKPLVYCGTVGIMPRKLSDDRDSHIKTPESGDLVYMVGGRVGSDGIHGATFSSLELTEDSPSSAVQIGDPITQKKMLDMLIEARDSGLIQVITDNGAGGLSSSVGEMAELTGGAEIDLGKVPLKQSGLSSWEILVSESQERMTVGIRPEDKENFEILAKLHEVEASEIGKFTDSGAFIVKHHQESVAYLPIEFLHNGCPQMNLKSEWVPPKNLPIQFPKLNHEQIGDLLCRLLSRPNIASKEWWVRSYDHEVIAQTVVKPFCGKYSDAPSDAAVIAPLPGKTQGAVISNGIMPRYSDIDAYAMAAASVDEAVRNAVCVGVDLDMIAGLDNFCWPDPVESPKTPDGKYKLSQLVRANQAIDDICRIYRLPCISGKDSMKNDAVIDGKKISVPPTILFSILGNHKDVRKAVTSDFKKTGDIIYLLGETYQELGASELAFMLRDEQGGGIGGTVPHIDAERNISLYKTIVKAMDKKLISSAHDCSDGGLAVSLAECCFGSDSGALIHIDSLWTDCQELDSWGALFGESLGRILVSIKPKNKIDFEQHMQNHSFHEIGIVSSDKKIQILKNQKAILTASLPNLKKSWQSSLNGGN